MIAFIRTAYIAGIISMVTIACLLAWLLALLVLPEELVLLSVAAGGALGVYAGHAGQAGWDHLPKKEDK